MCVRLPEAKVLITDTEFAPVIGQALRQLDRKPLLIDIDDATGPDSTRLATWITRRFSRRATRASWK